MNVTEVIVIISHIFLASINNFFPNETSSNETSLNETSAVPQSTQLFPASTIDDVKHSWTLINSDMEAVGRGILFKIFEKYPQYLEKFDALKTIPMDELKNNREFLTHCGRIGGAVGMVVENLDKPDVLIPALKSLGKRHIAYKVLREHFLNAEPMVLEFVAESLRKRGTVEERVLESWKEVLHAGIATIITGQEDE